FRHEVDTWCRLEHAHVLPFLGICVDGPTLYMCSPWQDNGDLTHYLKAHVDADRLSLMAQTADALDYLHQNGIVHGDIKGNNVLISSKGDALLCDFGLAIVLSDIAIASGLPSDLNGGGTMRYMAPELFARSEDIEVVKTMPSDVFAFGMLLAETITGKIPMSHLRVDWAVMMAIIEGGRPRRPTEWRDAHEDLLWALAERCWVTEPAERPSSQDIHASLRSYLVARQEGQVSFLESDSYKAC
ncbi:kinase-like protein, partial [Schizophyllum commune]